MNIFVTNKSAKLKMAITGVLSLLVFLFALFVHQDHAINLTDSVDKQDCYVCQQGFDTPTEISSYIPAISISYIIDIYGLPNKFFYKNIYIIPQLRAPPLIT